MLTHSHHCPGAIILGGSFPSVAAARSLARSGIDVCVIGSSLSVARCSRSVSQFIPRPAGLQADELPDYLKHLAGTCNLRGRVLFPTDDEDSRIVAQQADRLGTEYILTTPPWEMFRFFYDKRLTYQLARQAGVATPHCYATSETDPLCLTDVDFPVVLKPAITSPFLRATNKKAYRANNPPELQRFLESMSRLIGASQVIVQELLKDPSKNLFSFAGYFKRGEPIAGLSVKRLRQFPPDFGRTSSLVQVIELPELRELARRLMRANDYTGLAELEFMWNMKHARFELLEVNARLWAWHSIAIAAGLDLPSIAFAEATGQTPAIGTARPGVQWMRLLTDVRAAAPQILSGNLSLRQYLTSLRSTTTFAVFSPSDPLPSVAEPFLLLLDRLNRIVRRMNIPF